MAQSDYDYMRQADELAAKFDEREQRSKWPISRKLAAFLARSMRWVRDGFADEMLRTSKDDE